MSMRPIQVLEMHTAQAPKNRPMPTHLLRDVQPGQTNLPWAKAMTDWLITYPGSETDLGEPHDRSNLLVLLGCASTETETPRSASHSRGRSSQAWYLVVFARCVSWYDCVFWWGFIILIRFVMDSLLLLFFCCAKLHFSQRFLRCPGRPC
jgi:hypothetical protein